MKPLFCDPLNSKIQDVSFHELVPLRDISPASRRCRHYSGLRQDILINGIQNAIYVIPSSLNQGKFFILDGHIRIDILKQAGHERIQSINLKNKIFKDITTENGAHLLLHESQIFHNAMRKGISVNILAKHLSISRKELVFRGNAINAICIEAQEILLRKPVDFKALKIIRLVKRRRQVEMANAMVEAGVYSHIFAIYLMSQTPIHQIIATRRKGVPYLSNEQLAIGARDAAAINRTYQAALQTHGSDMLNLSLASSYISMMMKNADYVRYLARQYPHILASFEDLICITAEQPALG